MANDIDKEEWMQNVLSSTQGMAMAQPPAGFYKGVLRKARASGRAAAFPVMRWAAAAVLLLALNISAVMHFAATGKTTGRSAAGADPVSMALQTESTYNY